MQVILDKTEREATVANERIIKLKREISEANAANAQMRADNAAQASSLHLQASSPCETAYAAAGRRNLPSFEPIRMTQVSLS